MAAHIAGEVFWVACALAVAGGFFAVVESLAVALMARWPFGIGLVAIRFEEKAARPPGLVATSAGRIGRIKYRVVEGRVCLFRGSYPLFPFPYGDRPGLIKGTISWADGRLTTTARYPFGVTVFILGWLVSFATGALISKEAGLADALLMVGGASAVALFSLAFLRVHEMRHFRQHIRDIIAFLQATPGLGEARGSC